MDVGDMYHVGIVVPELTAAQARLTELLGTQWGPITEPVLEWRDGEGTVHTTQLRISFGDGPPYIELIEERPGTLWECNEHSNLHHIGYWSGAVAAESHRLGAAACPLQGTMATEADPSTFAYHRDPLGIRLELVDDASREGMASMFGPRDG